MTHRNDLGASKFKQKQKNLMTLCTRWNFNQGCGVDEFRTFPSPKVVIKISNRKQKRKEKQFHRRPYFFKKLNIKIVNKSVTSLTFINKIVRVKIIIINSLKNEICFYFFVLGACASFNFWRVNRSVKLPTAQVYPCTSIAKSYDTHRSPAGGPVP